MRKRTSQWYGLADENLTFARDRWGVLPEPTESTLRTLSEKHRFSIARGELLLLNSNWYVTHVGLIAVARRSRCRGIDVVAAPELCDVSRSRWAFRATVYTSPTCRGFVGYGDADPSNTSPQVRGAEMRVAETRAVNRALRKAYGIGLCSVEELGSERNVPPENGHKKPPGSVRDQLRLLIRRHELDGRLVKAYAVDFCGTQELRQASREKVEEFVRHLANYAAHDREALLCQLNSYSASAQAGAA